MSLNRNFVPTIRLAVFALLLGVTFPAMAQIGGTGWKAMTVSFNVQSPTNAPQNTRYFFTNNIYHCLTYSTDGAFSLGNTTRPRTEMRFNPDFVGNEVQYQAVMMVPATENSYCIMQDHTGDAQSPTYGPVAIMFIWLSKDGGSIWNGYTGHELAKNMGNQWFQLNVDHNVATHTIRVWINQQLIVTEADVGATDYYYKTGVYEQDLGTPTLEMDTYVTNSIKMWSSSGTNPPAAPTGLAAAPTPSQISLTWTSSVAATSYNLKRSTTNGGSHSVITNLTGTSYTDTNLTVGVTYYYVVSALDQFGESSNSTQVATSLFNLGYQLSVSPSTLSLIPGNSTNLTVTMVTNNTFSGATTLGLQGLPYGATANFNPPSLSAAGTSTLTLGTATNTPSGPYLLTLAGTNGASVYTTPVNATVIGVSASPGTLLWTAAGAGTNWSTFLNWTNLTAGGYGPPGPANNLQFTNTATVSLSGTVNNVVDTGGAIASLQYANNAISTSPNYHTTLIGSGQTLVITNGLIVGTATDAGENQVVNAAIAGTNATLILSNGVLAVTQGSGTDGAHQAVLNLSALDTLDAVNILKLAVAVYQTPAQSGNGGQRSCGVLYLARTNVISAASTGVTNGIVVGWNDSQGNGNNFGVPNAADLTSALYLGQTNSIFTDAVYVGTDKTLGCLLAFNPNGLNNPGAFFRNRDGVSRVSLWGIGDTSMKAGSNQSASGTNDFSGGTIDAQIVNMTVGVSQTGASGGNTGDGTGVLTFDTGTIDVNNLTNGWSIGTGANDTDIGSGTINVNGTGTLKVNNTLALALSMNGGAGVPTGTLNLNGGTVLGTNIIAGSGVSAINLNSGTLNLQGGGQIANVTTLAVGSNNAAAPALLTGAATIQSPNGIVIAANGTLAGNTAVTSPNLTVYGTLSPGVNATGALTNNGTATFGAGGTLTMTVQNAGGPPITGWSFLQVNGALNLQASNANPFTIQLQSFDPNGSGLVTNFNSYTNYNWPIATATGGIANFSAGAFAIDTSQFQNNLNGGFFYLGTNGNSLVLTYTNPPALPMAMNLSASGGNLVFSGSNGSPGTLYYVLCSTNLTLPPSQWTFIATNNLDGNGNFDFTNPASLSTPQSFYMLKLQ